jgi:hypothetical protein
MPDRHERAGLAFERSRQHDPYSHFEGVVVVPVRVAALFYRLVGAELPTRARSAGVRLDGQMLDVLDAMRRAALVPSEPISGSEVVKGDAVPVPSSACTTRQAAARLGISERAVVKRLHRGRLEGRKVRGRWYVTDSRARSVQGEKEAG